MLKTATSIFMIAESRLLRETLTGILKKKGGFVICGASPGLPGIASSIAESGADVLILDSALTRPSDCALISEIRTVIPKIAVLLIEMEDDREIFVECVRAGVGGYLLKDASSCEIISAIQEVAQGHAVCPPKLCKHLFCVLAEHWQQPRLPNAQIKLEFGLTRRQQQLLPFIARGLTNKEIAAHLNISEQTVKNHIHTVFKRVGATDRFQVIELTRF